MYSENYRKGSLPFYTTSPTLNLLWRSHLHDCLLYPLSQNMLSVSVDWEKKVVVEDHFPLKWPAMQSYMPISYVFTFTHSLLMEILLTVNMRICSLVIYLFPGVSANCPNCALGCSFVHESSSLQTPAMMLPMLAIPVSYTRFPIRITPLFFIFFVLGEGNHWTQWIKCILI